MMMMMMMMMILCGTAAKQHYGSCCAPYRMPMQRIASKPVVKLREGSYLLPGVCLLLCVSAC